MTVEEPKTLNVGLIMPISAIEDCTVEHWMEVQSIFVEALTDHSNSKCDVKMVSDADSVEILHRRIIKNVYDKDIVICDVSCKNPNVMFELGMRLAFDKPTVIVKDDLTAYTFDTGPIEHLEYPRNLRFSKIVEFKKLLASKTDATYKAFLENPDSTFLKSFGPFKVASLNETEVPAQTLIVDMLQDMQAQLGVLRRDRSVNLNAPRYATQDIEKLLAVYMRERDITREALLETDLIDAVNFIVERVSNPQDVRLSHNRIGRLILEILRGTDVMHRLV